MSKRKDYIKIKDICKKNEKNNILKNIGITEKIKLYTYSKIDPFLIISKSKPTKYYLKNCLKGDC